MPSDLTLRSRRDGERPELGSHGRPQLDGRHKWLVAGPAEDIEGVVRALGPANIATRLSDSLAELEFGNTVGFVWAGPRLKRIEVVAGKWTAGTWRILTTRLLDEIHSLPFSASGAGGAPTVGDTPLDRMQLYQAFVYLKYVIGSPETGARPDLTGAYRSILARPHRTPTRLRRIVPTALARQVDATSLIAIASGELPLIRMPNQSRIRGYIPTEVHESVLHHTLNNGENQFARALLRQLLSITFQLRRLAQARHDGFGQRLVEEIDFIEAQLEPIERHSMWADIGWATGVPANSTVLQRRFDYRTLFQHHIRLRLGLRLPISPDALQQLVELKNVATLYELWCAFAVLRAVRNLLGPPTSVQQPRHSTFDTTIPWGLLARWRSHGVSLYFNPTFSPGATEVARRSSSLQLRPDVLLEVAHTRHVLDAKFKLSSADIPGPKAEDLQKMHTYRDALPIDSAWVLYPGAAETVHYQALDAPTGSIAGVGAVPVDVHGDNPLLQECIRKMLAPAIGPPACKACSDGS